MFFYLAIFYLSFLILRARGRTAKPNPDAEQKSDYVRPLIPTPLMRAGWVGGLVTDTHVVYPQNTSHNYDVIPSDTSNQLQTELIHIPWHHDKLTTFGDGVSEIKLNLSNSIDQSYLSLFQ